MRELKALGSEIVRAVRDQRAHYLVTYRGWPVGVPMPLEEMEPEQLASPARGQATAWDELVRLGEEIGRGWQSPLTGPELLDEMRR